MIWISLAINILVLVPVCAGLLGNMSWTQSAYGAPSAARGILLSIYLAILVVSILLALLLAISPSSQWTDMAIALFAVQVAYKVTTPFTVGTLRNPVVISNVLIAAVHAATISVTWTP